MITPESNIAVGLSGGKDSIVLLYVLNKIKRYYNINFNLKAITLDPCFNETETNYTEITKFWNDLGIDRIIKKHPIWEIIFKIRQEKNPCSLCSRMRHGILHNICIEENCKIIALGHNMDDIIETFLMNLLYGGNISVFSPVSYLSRKKIHMIRPLIFCSEDEILKFAIKEKLPICKSNCPIDGLTSRESIKNLIKQLEHTYPNVRKKILHAIESKKLNEW